MVMKWAVYTGGALLLAAFFLALIVDESFRNAFMSCPWEPPR